MTIKINNFILQKPVLFEEVLQLIPKNAIVIEIAPHGLLQSILCRSLAKEVTCVSLTKRNHLDNRIVLSTALGK